MSNPNEPMRPGCGRSRMQTNAPVRTIATPGYKNSQRGLYMNRNRGPPPIAPGPQVWRTRAAIGAERCGDLRDVHLQQGRFDNHLGSEFHTRRSEIQALKGLTRISAQAAIEVANRGMIEQLADGGERWGANVTVLPRHCAGLDSP